MHFKHILASAAAVSALALLPCGAQAETLATPSSRATGAVPTRGLSMSQVERRFGAPLEKLPSAGGDSARHPVINRWRYGGYTVYFERDRVIHSVMNPASGS